MILGNCNLAKNFIGFQDTVRRRAHKADSLLIEITLGFKFPPWSFEIVLGLVIKWSAFEGSTSAETLGWLVHTSGQRLSSHREKCRVFGWSKKPAGVCFSIHYLNSHDSKFQLEELLQGSNAKLHFFFYLSEFKRNLGFYGWGRTWFPGNCFCNNKSFYGPWLQHTWHSTCVTKADSRTEANVCSAD